MENGQQWFHSDVQGLHLLFEPFLLNEDSSYLIGYIFIGILCASERGITYYLDHKLSLSTKVLPTTIEHTFHIMAKTVLYGIATTLRLLYMLVVMYFNTSLFILIVSSLTISQLVIEIIKSSNHCDKTSPLSKLNNDKGYSDLSTNTTSAIQIDDEDDDDDDYINETRIRQYTIPRIVISSSNEEKCYSTEVVENK